MLPTVVLSELTPRSLMMIKRMSTLDQWRYTKSTMKQDLVNMQTDINVQNVNTSIYLIND